MKEIKMDVYNFFWIIYRKYKIRLDIKNIKGKTIFEKDQRLTPRLIRKAKEDKVDKVLLPNEAIINQFASIDIYDENTGEIHIEAGQVIDESMIEKIDKHGIESIRILEINSRLGPYIRNTLIEADKTSSRIEALADIYRIMRPGEPPTEETSERLFYDLFFTKAHFKKDKIECKSSNSEKSQVLKVLSKDIMESAGTWIIDEVNGWSSVILSSDAREDLPVTFG